MTHRFFIPPDWLTPPTVTLRGETARQIRTVLRMQPDDEIIVLDGSGQEWRARLTEVGAKQIRGRIIAHQMSRGEPTIRLTLYQGTLKGQKFEWVLQKGTELGVCRFAPTICRRSITRDKLDKKRERWQRIIQEAAEQSGRGRLPDLAPAMTLAQALQEAQPLPLRLMLWEEANRSHLKQILRQTAATEIALFIGPEGGFTPQEAEQAAQAGARIVQIGPRILRAETAGLVACAAIFYELGEWG